MTRLLTVVLAGCALLLSACGGQVSPAPGTDPGTAAVQVLATASTSAALGTQAAGDFLALRLFVSEVTLMHEGEPQVLATYEVPLELELLGLADLEAELADAVLPTGVYQDAQLRLVLDRAELEVEGESGGTLTHTLKVPSGAASGYKIQLQEFVLESDTVILLDFDPERSVVETGAGGYLLKPVVQAVSYTP